MNSTAKYSIRNLESLTGILSHTIRIWEKRYQLLTPSRTETNLRLYSDDDLRKLLNVTFLNENGIKISAIAKMSDEEIGRQVLDLQQSGGSHETVIKGLTTAMLDLDEVKLRNIIDQAISKSGVTATFEEVIFPFFIRIGFMWQTGSINPAQEHFVSMIVRQKLIAATDALPANSDPETKPVVFFLPEDELHELSLLYYHYILRESGVKTLYLGQAVPVSSLSEIIRFSGCESMVFISTSFSDRGKPAGVLEYLNSLGVKFYCSGMQMKETDLSAYANLLYFEGGNSLLNFLHKIR